MPRFNRLLITGASGNLGRELRRGLAPLAATLRLTDRGEMAPASDNEEVMPAELGDFDAVMQVVEGLRRDRPFRCRTGGTSLGGNS